MERILSEYDIVIVGAGPAGCVTAKFLNNDYKVLLVDWSKLPRDKPCGGVLVEESKEFLNNFFGKIPVHIFSYPKTLDIIYSDFDNDFEVLEKRNFFNISRQSFDYWLLKNVEKAQIAAETKLVDFEQKVDHVKIMLEKNNKKFFVKSKYLIGADGALSLVRSKIFDISIRRYVAFQEWFNTDFNIKNLVFIYDSSINDYYSWIIPKGNFLLIGLAINSHDDAESKIKLLKEKIFKKYKISGNASKKEGAVSLRPQSSLDCTLGKGRVLLVGEAAGLVSPASGEGISFALRSGYNCAKALNANFKNGLIEYKKLCQNLLDEIETKIKRAKILSNPIKRLALLKNLG
ncbi:MAG: FAD-dependent monooxygenase [Nitrososphaeria archaeon]